MHVCSYMCVRVHAHMCVWLDDAFMHVRGSFHTSEKNKKQINKIK